MPSSSTKEIFCKVFESEQLFPLFIKYNLNNKYNNNQVLFWETCEALLEQTKKNDYVNAIDRIIYGIQRSVEQCRENFDEIYASHVHQICLTYLIQDAPFPLGLNVHKIHVAASRAALSPIPRTVFDEVLDLIIENLYYNVFPGFAAKYQLIDYETCSTLSREKESEELTDISFDEKDFPFLGNEPNYLLHKTSEVFDYINSTANSVYSDLEFETGSDFEFNFEEQYETEDVDQLTPLAFDARSRVNAPITPTESTSNSLDTLTENIRAVSLDSALDNPKWAFDKRPFSSDDEAVNMIVDIYSPTVPTRRGSLDPNVNNLRNIKYQYGNDLKIVPPRRQSLKSDMKNLISPNPEWRKAIKNTFGNFFMSK